MSKGKELIIQIVWNKSIDKNLFSYLSSAAVMPTAEKDKNVDEDMEEEGVKLQHCLSEFKQMETLDEDNMWYCNQCKDHV